MNPQLASALRWVLVLAAGFLVARGQLAQGQEATFADSAVQVISAGVALYALVWGQRDKRLTADALNSALASPAGTPPQTVKALAALGAPSFRDLLIRQAISTVAALVGDKVSRGRFGRPLIQLRDALNAAFPPAQ